jgi:hypothetical protein
VPGIGWCELKRAPAGDETVHDVPVHGPRAAGWPLGRVVRPDLEGRGDGGQVGRPAAGAAGGGIFPDCHVADLVVRLDGPVLADQAGQVLGGRVGAGQAGDGVDDLAGGSAGNAVLPPAGDLDGLPVMREVQAADVKRLQGAGLGAAVPASRGRSGRPVPATRAGS